MSLTSTGLGPNPTSLVPSITASPYSAATNFPTVSTNGSYITSSPTSFLSGNNSTPTPSIYTTASITSNAPIFPSNWGLGSGGSDLIVSGARNTSSLSVQFVICFVAGVIFFLAFCFLRTRLPVIFAPRANMKRHKPPELPNSYFGWIIPLLRIDTEELLLNVGLDAVLNFICLDASIFNDEHKDFWYLFFIWYSHPTPNQCDFCKLIAYLVFAYFVTFVTFFFLTQSYYNYIYLHAKYLLNQSKQMVARSVIVTGIPEQLRTDQALSEYYNNLNIGSVESCYVVRNVHKLNQLIKQRASALKKLEEAYAKYWGNPCSIPGYDPERILDDVEMYKKVLDQAENKKDESSDSSDNENGNTKAPLAIRLTKRNTWKKAMNTTFIKSMVEPLDQKKSSRRPTVRTGFLGLFGRKVDAIEHYTVLFDDLDRMTTDLRASPNYEMTNVAFVTFDHMSSAVIASQIAIHPEPFACRTIMAYEPRDVLWSSVSIRGRERIVREIIVWAITVVLVIFWFVPVVVLSSLMSINMIKRIAPKVADAIQQNAATSNFMTSFVPTVVLNIVTSILPLIFDALGYYQGLRSRSAVAESTLSKYFFFLVFFTLIVFTLAGTSIETVMLSFANDPSSIPEKLAATFPSISPFFINYTILQGFLLMPMNLLLLGSLIVRGFNHTFFCKTPREHAENRTPWSFNYGIGYPVPLLIFVVVLEYSCISPLILLFGTIYFCFTFFVYKYQFLYVYFRPYEAADRAFLQNARNLPMQLLQDNIQKLPSALDSLENNDEDDESDRDTEIMQQKESPLSEQRSLADNNIVSAKSSATTEKTEQRKKAIRNQLRNAALSAVQLKAETTDPTQSSEPSMMIIRPRHRKVVLDEDDYEAIPDRLTDYRQPPMQLNPGLLDTGLKKFGNPLLVGILPQLWLPVKEPEQASKEGKMPPLGRHQSDLFHSSSEGGGRLAQHLAEVLRKIEMEAKNKKNKRDGDNNEKKIEKVNYDKRAEKARDSAHIAAASTVQDLKKKHLSALHSLFKKSTPKKKEEVSTNIGITNDLDHQENDRLESIERGVDVVNNAYSDSNSFNKSIHSNHHDLEEEELHTIDAGYSITSSFSQADNALHKQYENTHGSPSDHPQNKRFSNS
ncbi:hypothetical protein G6F32_006052 [Rhizopus arrhizus]|nr:hypothetical protein G6F32_006052 [Rhizopus arrhizus]